MITDDQSIKTKTSDFLFNGERIFCLTTTETAYGIKKIAYSFTTERRATAEAFIKLLERIDGDFAVAAVAPFQIEVCQINEGDKTPEQVFNELFDKTH